MNERLLSMLGMCKRAGRLCEGNDVVIDCITSKKSKLVLLAGDISPKTEKGITGACRDFKIKLIKLEKTKDEIGEALGKYSAVLSVNDTGFAKAISKIIADLSREEFSV